MVNGKKTPSPEIPKGSASDLELLERLDFSKSLEEIEAQKTEIDVLQRTLGGIVSKLKDKDSTLDLDSLEPDELMRLVEQSDISWSPEESLAIRKAKEGLDRLPFISLLPSKYWKPVIEQAKSKAMSEAKSELQAQVERERLKKEVGTVHPTESPEVAPDYYSIRNGAYIAIQEMLKSGDLKAEESGRLMGQEGWKTLEGKVSGSTAEEIRQVTALSPEQFGRLGMASVVVAVLDQWERDKKLVEAKEGESLWGKLSAKTKKFYQEHTGMCQIALVAGGAYVSYRLIKYLWGRRKKDESKEGEKTGWFPNPLALGALAVAGIGVYLGRNRIGEWLKETFGGLIGANEALKKGQKMAELAAKGDFLGAAAIYAEIPDTNPELHQKVSERFAAIGVEIPTEILKNAGPMGYEAFMSQHNSWFGYATGRIKEFVGDKWITALYHARSDYREGGKKLYGIFKALEATKDPDGNPLLSKDEAKDKTVDEVLGLLMKKDLVSMREALVAKMSEEPSAESPEGAESDAGYLAMAATETAETYTGLFSDIKNESLEQLPPKVKEVIQKYKKESESKEWAEKNIAEKIAWGGTYAWDVVSAVTQESGSSLLVSAGGIFIQSAKETGKWILIGSNKTVISAFWELATLDPMGAFEHYMAGATPFMIAGAGIGLLTKKGMVRGAWAGAKLPWTIVKKEAEIITKIGFYGRPDVLKRYASLGVFSAKTELAYKAKWLTHWGRSAKERRLLVYEADRLIGLKEQLALVGERILSPGLGKRAAENLQKELEEEIDHLERRLSSHEEILKARKALRLEQIFGENAQTAIEAILKDPKLEELFLRKGSLDVVQGLLKTNRPDFFVKLLQGDEGKGLLEIIENKKLLNNRKFLEVMGDFDKLFSPTGEVDQKILAEIVQQAEKLDLPMYERMLTRVREAIRAPARLVAGKWQASAEWLTQRKAIQACVRSFDKYIKAPASTALARFNEWRGPKFDQSELEMLAKERNPTKIKNLLKSKGLKRADWAKGAKISEVSSVEDVKFLVEEAAKAEGKIVKFAPGISRLSSSARFLRYAKFAPKAGAGALALLPAAFDYYEAATTENKEKADMLVSKGVGNTVAAGIEIGLLYGMGAAVSGKAAIAIAPWAYMWNVGYESAMEQAKKSNEWATEYDHETLVHQWLSTGIGTAGEAYHRFFTSADEKTYEESFKKTRKEILTAIFLTEGERFPKENEYRLTYLEKANNLESPGFDYAKALEALHDSRLFAEVMMARENGMQQLGKLELADARFAPEAIKLDDVIGVVVAYKREVVNFTHPALAQKFDKMATGALVSLYWELDKAFANEENRESLSDNEEAMRKELKHYLFYVRHVEADAAVGTHYLKAVDEKVVARLGKLPENGEELKKARQEALEEVKKDVDVGSTLAKLELLEGEGDRIPEEPTDDNPGCYALGKLAEYLGYDGPQTEAGLRGFFTENRADAFGLYFKEGVWYGNESWWKDMDLGAEVNENMVRTVIAHFRKNPKDVLEHRGESIALWGEGLEFENQVLKRADILEKALGEYPTRKAKAPEVLAA